MNGSVFCRLSWVICLFLAGPAFGQDTGEPSGLPDRDYTMSVLEYNGMINDAMSAYKHEEYDEAFPLLLQLAVWGEKDCQWALGLMYFEGQGVSENVLEAYAWMKTAAESGIPDWEKTVKRLHKSLPDQHKEYVDQYADEYLRLYGMRATGIQCGNESGGGRAGVKSRRIECHRPVSLNQTIVHLTPPIEIATD